MRDTQAKAKVLVNQNDELGGLTPIPILTPIPYSDPYSKEPASKPPNEFNPLAEMSDERLERKRMALSEAIANIQKLQMQNVEGYNEAASDAASGKAAAWGAVKDASTTLAFYGLGKAAKTPGYVKAVKDGESRV